MTNEKINEKSDSICNKITEIESSLNDITTPIPINLISNKGKILKILNNADESEYISIKNSTLTISFKEPIYCRKLSIQVKNLQGLKGVKVSARNPVFGKEIRYSTDTTNNHDHIAYPINSFVTEVSITPPETYILSKSITQISLTGITALDFLELEASFKSFLHESAWIKEKKEDLISEIRSAVEDLENKKQDSTNNLSDIKNQTIESEEILEKNKIEIKQLEKEIKDLELQKTDTIKSIEGSQAELKSAEARHEAINSARERVQSELSILNTTIVEKEAKLKELNENVNLFTEDFAAYIAQTKKQELVYLLVISLPIIITCAIAYQLLSGAVDLTFRFQREQIDLIALFSSRIPYVITATAIITACAKIIQIFSREIINLHEGRRNLAQISIIAKDISDSESDNIGMTKEEVYENRIRLKMDLLKSHISGMMHKYRFKSKSITSSLLAKPPVAPKESPDESQSN
ncbi:hypothetical protein [Chromobacterium haemolyticum]|uniref:hypothetical protein n=1 Tax=Chromobacterium TaxID=535 RepID=UPI004056ABB0